MATQSPSLSPSKIAQIKKEKATKIRIWATDDPEDVLFDTLFGLRTIELNRPKKLHSLNGSMVRKTILRLQEWAKSDMANVVVIKGAGPKAFCAGGDVTALAIDNKTGEEGIKRSTHYFGQEYQLDHLIATYTKPIVAFLDGITMGGGVGLSVHAPFRIATERTVFAMPETTIGFFPDVGASFFLPRMPGAVGTYLALTSEKLKGANVFYSGIATHYLHSTSLPALERRLAELRFKDYDTMETRLELIDSTIEEFCTGLPYDEPILLQKKLRNDIDKIFGKRTVPEILAALEAEVEAETKDEKYANERREKYLEAERQRLEEGGVSRQEISREPKPASTWARDTLKTIRQRSPTSVYVTLRQMQLGRRWSISETFQREHQIAGKFMKHPDFTEGVHALLIRKDGKPQWTPASLDDIKPGQNIADPFFEVEGAERLELLSDVNYMTYPHEQFSIPKEADIERFVKDGGKTFKSTLDHFMKLKKSKQGVKEVVTEILDRKTSGTDKGLAWNDTILVAIR